MRIFLACLVLLPGIAGALTLEGKASQGGLMIGRAAQGRPWIFNQVLHYFATGEHLPDPSIEEIQQLLTEHLDNLYAFYGEYAGVRVARKHISWYSKGQPHGAAFRQIVNRVEDAATQRRMVNEFFEELLDRRALAA